MENEGSESQSPQEALAAEVAGDESQTGSVTPDDVAEVLGQPKPTATNGDGGKGDDTEDASSDDDSDNDAAADTDDGDGSGDDDDEVEDTEEDDQEEDTDTADVSQFVLKVTDANGKEYTIDPDDDIEKVLEDFEPKSNGQIFSILKQLQNLKSAKDQFAADQETKAKDDAYRKQITEVQNGWNKEIEMLQGEKRIPVEADGKVPARVTEVFKYINSENEKRLKDGRPLLHSFEDALDKLELRESKDETKKKDKQERETARKRGAVVGGSSAQASSGVSPYRRGARTATQALRQMGVLR